MRQFPSCAPLAALWFGAALPAAAQAPARVAPLRGSLEQRLGVLLDQRPFDQATWGVFVIDQNGRVLFQRNANRLFVPASNAKLVVSAAAAVLLPADYRGRTSIYVNGSVADGVVRGDLVLYGRGDPTYSTRCYGIDTLAAGVCDSAVVAMGALADSVRARGVRRVTGRLIGDGSYFEPRLLHPTWELFDATWRYAAPVSGLAFNDNSIDFLITPGPGVDTPPAITWTPLVGLATFENRARTVAADSSSTIGDNFFRKPGTWEIWTEGTVPAGRQPWTESVAVPDPNLYAAGALAAALRSRGIAVEGGAASTTDSSIYRSARVGAPLAERLGRPLGDVIFPILNASENTFAEHLLKVLGREIEGTGSWEAGLLAERRFLMEVVGVDSTSFSLVDGSGLSTANLITPRALVRLLDYMYRHPRRDLFLRGLPRPGQPGTLLRRLVGTAVESQVAAKTGSITHVNTLSGYVESGGRRRLTFSIQANSHTAPSELILAQIDSVVVEIAR